MAPPKTSVVTSYDQKPKKVNEYQINEYEILSVTFFYFVFPYFLHLSVYAHIEVLVTFLLVNFLGLLVITRDHGSFERRH